MTSPTPLQLNPPDAMIEFINSTSARAISTRHLWEAMSDCPFCHAQAADYHISVSYSYNPSDMTARFMGECGKCSAMGPSCDTPEDALDKWNKFTRTPDTSSLVEALGRELREQIMSTGRVEWGATEERNEAGHLADFADTLRLTREHFNFADVPVKMHGLYLEGTSTVICHTGTSPNSAPNAQILAGLWNWIIEQVKAHQDEGEGA